MAEAVKEDLVSLKDFRHEATHSPDVDYYGKYNGRGFHKGYAIKASGSFDYQKFCQQLREEGLAKIADAVLDQNSRARIEVELSPTEFGDALSGISHVNCEVVYPEKTERLGKVREMMELRAEVGPTLVKSQALEILKRKTPKGWVCDTYTGYKNFIVNGVARTTAYRWVDQDDSA